MASASASARAPSTSTTWRGSRGRSRTSRSGNPLAAAADDRRALRERIAWLGSILWAPLQISVPEASPYRAAGWDLIALARAAEPFVPARNVRAELGEADLAEVCLDYQRALTEAGLNVGVPDGWPEGELPAGEWRAMNDVDEHYLPGPEDAESAHWGDDPDRMQTLLYTDGARVLEVRLHPHELVEVLALYESPDDFLVRGVLHRIADAIEARLARGEGWTAASS